MATQVSSLIGADLSGLGSTTALFAVGTIAFGTSGNEMQYCEATATLITGQFVLINQNNTAKILTTARLTGISNGGYDIAVAQNLVNQGEFAWFAKRGRNVYVLTSASLTAFGDTSVGVGFGANSGRLIAGTNIAVGNSLLGCWITSSVLTADYAPGVPTLATLAWPRIPVTN